VELLLRDHISRASRRSPSNGRPKVLVEDWYKDSQTQARLRTAVEEVLDETLPESYGKELFKSKRDKVYDLAYEYSRRKAKWAA
jgi:type I restriction enzyme R subunit